jgi:hypothetical protein
VSSDSRQSTEFCWGALAARALHPIQVQIIEALSWIDLPLSGGELSRVVEIAPPERVIYHMRRLTTLGALVLTEAPTPRVVIDTPYRLVTQPRSDDR